MPEQKKNPHPMDEFDEWCDQYTDSENLPLGGSNSLYSEEENVKALPLEPPIFEIKTFKRKVVSSIKLDEIINGNFEAYQKHILKEFQTPELEEENLVIAKCVVCNFEFRKRGNQRRYEMFYGKTKHKEIADVCCESEECRSQCISCRGCERLFRNDIDLYSGYCQSCVKNASRILVRQYSFKAEMNFQFRGESQDQIYYGIELEYESDDINMDTLRVHTLLGDERNPETVIGVLKKDISIGEGFEIVSVPSTIDQHHVMWDDFFAKLPPTCKPLHSCGMHVHATRIRMTDLHIGKILAFLHKKENRDFIRLIAGRDSSFHNDFEAPKSLKDSRAKGIDRHTALNLNNENTIEFRIFASTRDKRIFLKNIEFCKALIKFTDMSARSIQESQDYKKFIGFVFKYRKQYEYLALFLETSPVLKLQ